MVDPLPHQFGEAVGRRRVYLAACESSNPIEHGCKSPPQQLKRASVVAQYDIIDSVAPGDQPDAPPDDLDPQRLGEQTVVLGDSRPRSALRHGHIVRIAAMISVTYMNGTACSNPLTGSSDVNNGTSGSSFSPLCFDQLRIELEKGYGDNRDDGQLLNGSGEPSLAVTLDVGKYTTQTLRSSERRPRSGSSGWALIVSSQVARVTRLGPGGAAIERVERP